MALLLALKAFIPAASAVNPAIVSEFRAALKCVISVVKMFSDLTAISSERVDNPAARSARAVPVEAGSGKGRNASVRASINRCQSGVQLPDCQSKVGKSAIFARSAARGGVDRGRVPVCGIKSRDQALA